MASSPTSETRHRDWLVLIVFVLVILLITGIPYFYAQRIAQPNNQFMGVVENIPDHFQYFSWMRESRDKLLVSNQLTPETSTALLFNLLWWVLGRVESLTGLGYMTLYQMTRLLAGAFAMLVIFWFCGLIFSNRAKRWTAFLVAVLGSGLGWVMIVIKYLTRVADAPNPFTIYTSEPNSFYTIMAFPHFTIATGLITLVLGMVLLAQRTQQLRYAGLGAVICLVLTLQHSYDFFTICGVIALYGLFLWLRDRQFPVFMLKVGLIIVVIAVWPALQAFYITQADEVWKGVLAQFGNAGAWTPAPYLLPILMGFGWLLALWALDIRSAWKKRDDTHLFIMAWFLAHFVLIYLPLNFQIHLLSGWQVIIGVLATIGLYTRVMPLLGRWFRNIHPQRIAQLATAGLLLLIIPTNVYIFAQRFLDLRRANSDAGAVGTEVVPADNRFFLSKPEAAALDFLAQQVNGNDVVLATLDMGQFVPALTGARSFIGHWAQTLDYYGKKDMVEAFYKSETSDAERQRIVDTYNASYIIYGPQEARIGSYDPSTAAFLNEVYNEGGVKVYKVTSHQNG